ncbi:ABC-type multidrug transport system fused ATPase/permease subunit [Sinorhizobium fredii]
MLTSRLTSRSLCIAAVRKYWKQRHLAPKNQKKTVSADAANPFGTIANLWPYMWPADRPDLKLRVIWATIILVAAKTVLVLVPYFFKWATDALNNKPDALGFLPQFLTGAVMLVLAYNLARLLQSGLNQLRDALFASVGQHAVRQLAYRTFVHMHQLSLRFHLERRTGGLSRIIERGTKGIETIVRFTILNSVPTLIEFLLTAVIFWWGYGFSYLLVTAVTVWLYIWFTVRASDWRIAIRRSMNDSDTDANTKAIDSLLNFETVKYFGNEEMEAKRFDKSMERYERAATQVWTSLGWLNFGQALIFGAGTAVMMTISALAVKSGEQTIGDFVFVNAMLIQLAIPAELHRIRLSRNPPGADRYRAHVRSPRRSGGSGRSSGCERTRDRARRDRFQGRAFRL